MDYIIQMYKARTTLQKKEPLARLSGGVRGIRQNTNDVEVSRKAGLQATDCTPPDLS